MVDEKVLQLLLLQMYYRNTDPTFAILSQECPNYMSQYYCNSKILLNSYP